MRENRRAATYVREREAGRLQAGRRDRALWPFCEVLIQSDGGVRITVHAQPGARRTAIIGVHGDALKIAIAAPPVDGKANEAIVILLAEQFGVPARQVRVVSGHKSRRKTCHIDGLALADATRRLEALLDGKAK